MEYRLDIELIDILLLLTRNIIVAKLPYTVKVPKLADILTKTSYKHANKSQYFLKKSFFSFQAQLITL